MATVSTVSTVWTKKSLPLATFHFDELTKIHSRSGFPIIHPYSKKKILTKHLLPLWSSAIWVRADSKNWYSSHTVVIQLIQFVFWLKNHPKPQSLAEFSTLSVSFFRSICPSTGRSARELDRSEKIPQKKIGPTTKWCIAFCGTARWLGSIRPSPTQQWWQKNCKDHRSSPAR